MDRHMSYDCGSGVWIAPRSLLKKHLPQQICLVAVNSYVADEIVTELW